MHRPERIPQTIHRGLLLGLVLSWSLDATGQDGPAFSPRVSRKGAARWESPDPQSPVTLAQDLIPADRDADAAIVALVTGVRRVLAIAPQAPRSGDEKIAALARVSDVLELWSTYGVTDSTGLADFIGTLWQSSGRGAARIIEFPENGIPLVELGHQGRWRVVDPVRRGWLMKTDGSLASFEEARSQPELWKRPAEPWFFPQDNPAAVQKLWSTAETKTRSPEGIRHHTGDWLLRRGETFTLFAKPQGHRWVTADLDLKDKARIAWWETEPAGPKTEAGALAITHGRFDWAVPLTHPTYGALVVQNLEPSEQGMTLVKPGDGLVIFQVQTPYPLVAELGKLTDAKDDKDASVIEVDAEGATLAWSKDAGATWITLETKTWPARHDLTAQVAGTYGYLLRVELKGKPQEAVLKSLRFTSWVQVAAGLFPALKVGKNDLLARSGDEAGLPTVAWGPPISTLDENSFLRPVIRPPRAYRPGDAQARVEGRFTARVATPPHSRIVRINVGGRNFLPAGSTTPVAFSLQSTFAAPVNFQPVPLVATGAEWDVQILPPDQPRAAYLECEVQPGLQAFRLQANCLLDGIEQSGAWLVTHRWRAGEETRSFTQRVTTIEQPYIVQVDDAAIDNEAIEYSLVP